MEDGRICPSAVHGQMAMFSAPYRLVEHHVVVLRSRLQSELERLKLLDEIQTEHRLSRTWRVSAMDALVLALAARDAAGQDLVDAAILDALPHRPSGVTAVLNKAGLLAPDPDRNVAAPPTAWSWHWPLSCTHAWLHYRHRRWPRTANPHLSSPSRPPAPPIPSARTTSTSASPPPV
jgi:hypothetical protein